MPRVTVTVTRREIASEPSPWFGASRENVLALLLARKGIRFKPSVDPTISDMRAPWHVEILDAGWRVSQDQD